MKSIMLKPFLIIAFLAISYAGHTQLIDPFGKIITHEIKMNKQKDGTYIGAVEWTTGGIDSLQRYVVNGLDINAPVMVRIVSKAPDHNIDLGFYKKNWDKQESKISTDGDKFVDKIFRTMNTAGLGVHSKVAGIPYLITVKVGLQFPSTQSLIRITDNKEEYRKHLRKMGFNGQIFGENNDSNSNSTSSISSNNNSEKNNSLMYIIIGLLAVIAAVLIVFLMKRKTSKITTLLVFTICFSSYTVAQSEAPKQVPIPGQGESPVFFQYRTQNVANQVPITDLTNTTSQPDKSGRIYTPVGIELGSGVKELTGDEVKEVQRRMQEATEEFDRNYRDNSPGVETEGDQRTLPTDGTQEELDQLRIQVQRLQNQVDLLSQEDEEFDVDEDAGGGALLYCEDLESCQSCLNEGIDKFNTHVAYLNYLQRFYLKEVDDLNDKIEYGNTLASMPGFGIAWGPILTTVIRPAMNELKAAYNKKFNEYIESLEADLQVISDCYQGENGRFRSSESFEIQAYAIINALKASRINK